MEYTTNLGLKKPAYSDHADIADMNGNMDVIDAESFRLSESITKISNLENPLIEIDVTKNVGGYIKRIDGEVGSSNAYWYSQNIPIKKGETLNAIVSGSSACAIAFYKSDGTYVRNTETDFQSGITEYSIVANENGYAIVSCLNSFTGYSIKLSSESLLVETVNANKETSDYLLDNLKEVIPKRDTIMCDFNENIGIFKFVSEEQTDDEGETVLPNEPVFSAFGYQGKKGIRITDASVKEALFLDVTDKDFSKFGCGVLLRPLQNSNAYDSNGMYVFHCYKDADNNIELKYRIELRKFSLSYKVGGTVFNASFTAPWNDVLDFKTRELIGLYLHFVSDRFVNIYLMYKGNVSVNTVYIPNLTPIAFNTFALGMRYRGAISGQLGTNATYQSNCIFANFKLEFGDDIRPIKYFEEVM